MFLVQQKFIHQVSTAVKKEKEKKNPLLICCFVRTSKNTITISSKPLELNLFGQRANILLDSFTGITAPKSPLISNCPIATGRHTEILASLVSFAAMLSLLHGEHMEADFHPIKRRNSAFQATLWSPCCTHRESIPLPHAREASQHTNSFPCALTHLDGLMKGMSV